MKQTTRAPVRRTAPGALRHNELERHRRQLHARRFWHVTAVVDGRRLDDLLNGDHWRQQFIPPGALLLVHETTDYGRRAALHFIAGPTMETPRPRPGQHFTNWQHAAL